MKTYRPRVMEVQAYQWTPEMGESPGVERDWNSEGMLPKGSKEKRYKAGLALRGGEWIVLHNGKLHWCGSEHAFRDRWEELPQGNEGAAPESTFAP